MDIDVTSLVEKLFFEEPFITIFRYIILFALVNWALKQGPIEQWITSLARNQVKHAVAGFLFVTKALREKNQAHFSVLGGPSPLQERFFEWMSVTIDALFSAMMYFYSFTFVLLTIIELKSDPSIKTALIGVAFILVFHRLGRFYRACARNTAAKSGLKYCVKKA